jgi:futalosine hydrolase
MLLLVPTALEAKVLFDGERAPCSEDPESLEIGGRPVRAALCGFGPAAAGALAALALARERPRRCLLLGLVGSYDLARLPVGGLFAARTVRFADLGAGEPGETTSPASLGFPQAPPAPGRVAVGDVLDVPGAPGAESLPSGLLLTVARTSGSPAEARERARAHPGALGEDMEGFAVVLAAARLGVAAGIVRAASNAAGEPDRSRWDVPRALTSLRAWLLAHPV